MQLLWLLLPAARPSSTLPFFLTSRTIILFRIRRCPILNDHNDCTIFPASSASKGGMWHSFGQQAISGSVLNISFADAWSVHTSIHPPPILSPSYSFIHACIHPPIHLSIHLSTRPSTHPPIYLSIPPAWWAGPPGSRPPWPKLKRHLPVFLGFLSLTIKVGLQCQKHWGLILAPLAAFPRLFPLNISESPGASHLFSSTIFSATTWFLPHPFSPSWEGGLWSPGGLRMHSATQRPSPPLH